MARPLCGHPKCGCSHETCDVGWITTFTPRNGQLVEAAAKCPECFPMPEPSTRSNRIVYPAVQQTDGDGEYADARSAAAGDR